MTEELFRDDATLDAMRGARDRARRRRRRSSTARCSIRWAAARPATPACCAWPMAASLPSPTRARAKSMQAACCICSRPTQRLPSATRSPRRSTSRAATRTCAFTRPRTCCARWCRTRWTAARSPPSYARLDFHMSEPLDKEALTAGIARLVAEAHPVQPALDQRSRTRRQPRPRAQHERAAAARPGARARARDRRRRSAALRRHACEQHARDRQRRRHEDREEVSA